MREIRRSRQREKVLEMSDPNWILATNADHAESILSKIRADFGVEASSRSTHFCSTVKLRSKRYRMSLQTTLGLDDRILQDNGLTRDAPLHGTIGPFWQ
jgi:hypothetical protein